MKTRFPRRFSSHVLPILLASLLVRFLLALPVAATESGHDEHHPAGVVRGYFEEWSIYFAGFNIANLQTNGVADKLTHLTYAFGDQRRNLPEQHPCGVPGTVRERFMSRLLRVSGLTRPTADRRIEPSSDDFFR